MNTINTEAC